MTSHIGLILAGHGSEFSSYRENVNELAVIIKKRLPFMIVKIGFLEISSPSIPDAMSDAVQEGAEKLVVVPVLLSNSRHTTEDIPKLLGMKKGQYRGTVFFKEHGEVQVAYCEPIGADSRLAEIIVDRAIPALKEFGLVLPVDSINDAGAEIFEESLSIVRQLIAKDCEGMDPQNIPIVERVVHATAEPEFARLLTFSKDAVKVGVRALRGGADVVVDVKMVEAGINARIIRSFGGKVLTYTDDERAVSLADRAKITRTAAAMQIAAEDGLDGDIVMVGNSPTAALAVADIVKRNLAKPALIIATPVGFVKSAESKEEVSKLPVPYVVTHGVKGGSAVAVAILNALLTIARAS